MKGLVIFLAWHLFLSDVVISGSKACHWKLFILFIGFPDFILSIMRRLVVELV